MGYCARHKYHWRDDEERDEQFACPICEDEVPSPEWPEGEEGDDDREPLDEGDLI